MDTVGLALYHHGSPLCACVCRGGGGGGDVVIRSFMRRLLFKREWYERVFGT